MVKLEMFERMTDQELAEAIAYWAVTACERFGLAITIAHLYVQAQAVATEAILGSKFMLAEGCWDGPKST